ncbi:unnamed protein product [Urochloa humidicola]
MALAPTTGQALLDPQLDLWGSTFTYIKSMALKSTVDLRIADAIERHGGAATLHQIAANAGVHPAKVLKGSGPGSPVPSTAARNGKCEMCLRAPSWAEPLYRFYISLSPF